MFSVMSASLSPFPSPHRMFSRGTFTLVKRMTPFSIALSPMKRRRCTTSTPGIARLDDERGDLLHRAFR